MKWPTVLAASAVALSLTACDKIPFLGKRSTPADTAGAIPDSAQLAAAAAATAESLAAAQSMAQPPPPPARASAPPRPLVDEPWTPVDTGTVVPGMTRDQIIAVWGIPVAERSVGNRTYLYYRNGCEVTCGTFDVVFLEDGQVVDAIVRGQGHTYAGTSSSPPGRMPAASIGQGIVPAPAPPATGEVGTPETAALAAAMEERLRTSMETPEGQSYEATAVAAFWGDRAFVQACAPPGGPVPQPFTIYFEVLRNGQLGLVVFHPETDVARCIGNAVVGRTFPPPPGDAYVAKISMTFQG